MFCGPHGCPGWRPHACSGISWRSHCGRSRSICLARSPISARPFIHRLAATRLRVPTSYCRHAGSCWQSCAGRRRNQVADREGGLAVLVREGVVRRTRDRSWSSNGRRTRRPIRMPPASCSPIPTRMSTRSTATCGRCGASAAPRCKSLGGNSRRRRRIFWVDLSGEMLAIEPRLPPQWRALSFRISCRGRSVAVRLTAGHTEATLAAGEAMEIRIGGAVRRLEPGATVQMPP